VEPVLQVLGNGINAVKITVRRRPARCCQIHPPPALPRPQEGAVIACKRCALVKVEEQGLGLVTLRCMAAGLQDPPPGNTAPVMAHDRTHLARSARSQEFGNVPVRHCGSCRHQPDNGQDRLDVLITH